MAKDYAHWRRVQETTGYISSAKAALQAGRDDEALDWAQKAIQTDPAPAIMKFSENVRKIVDDYRAEETSRKKKTPAPRDGGILLWPLLPAFGLGAAAYAVAKSRKTVESADGYNENDRPQAGELQRFVAGSILAGLAGAGLYLGGAFAVGAAAPAAARFMSGPGQQAVYLAQSEVGAINPSSILRIGDTNLKLSHHAVERISQRGLSLSQIESALVEARGFQYFHDGAWKIGYYDPASEIFLGQHQGNVITVISNVKPQYIENLRGLKP